MESTMPARDDGTYTYWHTWEEDGQMTHIDRQSTLKKPAMVQRTRYGRQTVQWPFQSITTIETAISSQLLNHSFTPMPLPLPPRSTRRPLTWAPKRMLPPLHRDSTSDLDADLVPDYVINYIRGETPEMVARRKMNDGKLGERGVDIVPRHKVHRSRAAIFGHLDDRSSITSSDFYGDGRLSSSTTGRDCSLEWQREGDGDAEDSRILLGDENGRDRPKGPWRRPVIVGWRVGVALNLLLTSLIFVVALVSFTLAKSRGSGGNWDETMIYTGACSTADHISWGIHAVVCVFTVVLLAGANYAFQVLSSPTRSDVEDAHSNRNWLCVGILSVRNLFQVGKSRGLAATGLVLMILTIQVLYNAVIFTSRTVTDLNIGLVTPSFLNGAPFSNATTNNMAQLSRYDILSLQGLASRKVLVNIPASNCITNFVTKSNILLNPAYEAVLIVSSLNSPDNSLIQTARFSSSYSVTDKPTSIQYCLAQRSTTPQTCSVNFHSSLLGAATLLNLFLAIFFVWLLFYAFKPSCQPLVSLGDAMASFLEQKDEYTRRYFSSNPRDWGVKVAAKAKQSWFQIPSVPTWIIFLISWTVTTTLAAVVLDITLHSDKFALSPFGNRLSHYIHLNALHAPPSTSTIAAVPQLLLALLYLSTNYLLTTYYLSKEMSLFSGQARPLRVTSSPQGSQTPSLYLTLPRPWSWFLVISFMAMSFVLSQSVFSVTLYIISTPGISSGTTNNARTTGIGFSGTGLLILLILLAILFFVIIGLGFRGIKPLPGVPSSKTPTSAEISSCCHPGQTGLERREVVWQVLDQNPRERYYGLASEERAGFIGTYSWVR